MTATSSTGASGSTNGANGTSGVAAGHHHHGKGKGGDIFSNLIQLLSATRGDDGSTGPLSLLGDDSSASAKGSTQAKGKGKGNASADMIASEAPLAKSTPAFGPDPSDIARAVMSGWPNNIDPASDGPKGTGTPVDIDELAGFDATGMGRIHGTDDLGTTSPASNSKTFAASHSRGQDGPLTDASATDATTLSGTAPTGADWRAMGMQATSGQERLAPDAHAAMVGNAGNSEQNSPQDTQTALHSDAATGQVPGGPRAANGPGMPSTTGAVRREGEASGKDEAPRTGAAQAKAASWRSTTALPNAVSFSSGNGVLRGERNAMPEGTVGRNDTLELRSTLQLGEASGRDAGGSRGGNGEQGREGHTGTSSPFQFSVASSGDADARLDADSRSFEVNTPLEDSTDAALVGGDAALQDDPGLWQMHGTHQASLRVGEEGEDAIDIQVRLAGQDVMVDLRTDNPELRANLAQHAANSLQDMMSRSGIQLTDVNVGSQSAGADAQQQQQQMSQQTQGDSFGRIQTRENSSSADERGTASVGVAPAPKRSDGSSPLDLFV